MADGAASLKTLLSAVNQFLKARNLQLSRSGFKTGWGKNSIDAASGFWSDPNYSRSKPPKWLVHIYVDDGEVKAKLPEDLTEIAIGMSNTAQGFTAALACRLQPVIKVAQSSYELNEDSEVDALFVFKGALTAGSSADSFVFAPSTGRLSRAIDGRPRADYVFSALLGLKPADTIVATSGGIHITYGDVLGALQALIHVERDENVEPIKVFDLTAEGTVGDVIDRVKTGWHTAGADTASTPPPQSTADYDEDPAGASLTDLQIPPSPDLFGISDSVYHQVNAALQSGKQHIMLYGPPGTGKTTLAQWIAENLPGSEWTLVTGSADWTSQDVIGGYQPVGGGDVAFVPGILLRAFDRPLIIDELNRCDIDKVLGPLFTVLSGQATTLPYRVNIGDPASDQFSILPVPKPNLAPHEYAPGAAWRLITTINSIDRASLYQMSYALSRRFAWVFIDAPEDLRAFISDYLNEHDAESADLRCPVAEVWRAVNAVRPVGPAPIIDLLRYMLSMKAELTFFGAVTEDARSAFAESFDMALLPMLDGISRSDADSLVAAIVTAFDLSGALAERISLRLSSAAI